MNSHKVFNGVLFSILVVLVLLNILFQRDYRKRNNPLINNMFNSEAYAAHEWNDFFADGRTLRLPPDGTIPRGHIPVELEPGPEGAKLAAKLKSPFVEPDPKRLLQGQAVYESHCFPCHGMSGLGDGLITKRGFPPPPSLLLKNSLDMSDGEMFHAITLGRGNMPAHGLQIFEKDRWKVIEYIRSIQVKQE